MLKAAKQHSGSSWNTKRNMVEGPPAMWTNLMIFPKIKKFNNNKATFPLFDALGELYDGHLAKGIYNVTSLETPGKRKNLLSNFKMLKMSHKALMTMWFMR
ncbi:hypothetical protein GQ55_7G012700 [Panicum hallii var. hallii]|uniref:Myb/SANT-like domain-containing protein n=1 Tax=Panicum hallii var. hallii TaxID=1504633 RepID=A0A2T7CRQ1_9POAL|nr:hypothetical protein GQ55_7G012700 [Panicum hallii var. hallii]